MRFTFGAIDIGVTEEEKQAMLDEVLALSDDVHHYNEFRGCRMIAIWNGGGRLGGRDPNHNTAKGDFSYTAAGDECPVMQRVLEEKIFPWMDPPGRVTILRTAPNTGLNTHLDSTKEEIGTLQHKYRLVLNGAIDKLFFIDSKNNKVYMPGNYDSYVLDGSHPHSIDPDPQEKITLCVGAPWKGQPSDAYDKLKAQADYISVVSRPETLDEWLDPAFIQK